MSHATQHSVQAVYPASLLDWTGHRKGGVRKPFYNDTGRPISKQIKIKLVNQLSIYLDDTFFLRTSTELCL